jgi:hypothetical protein
MKKPLNIWKASAPIKPEPDDKHLKPFGSDCKNTVRMNVLQTPKLSNFA